MNLMRRRGAHGVTPLQVFTHTLKPVVSVESVMSFPFRLKLKHHAAEAGGIYYSSQLRQWVVFLSTHTVLY
jgi:hypothetical protein